MNVLVIGADGFIGRHVYNELIGDHIVTAGINPNRNLGVKFTKFAELDLLKVEDIKRVLSDQRPEVIVNCAGVVDPGVDSTGNLVLTKNILESAHGYANTVRRVILMGSAASYGVLSSPDELPVAESTPLRAEEGYALSKRLEEEYALEYAKENGMDVIVARIFNPIGKGMKRRFLIPALIEQINKLGEGSNGKMEVSRLDSERDYIDVIDVAVAIRNLVDAEKLNHNVYNIGSGKATSNREIIDTIISVLGVEKNGIELVETSSEKEAIVASRADIGRISKDTGWRPVRSINETIEELIDAR